MSWFECVRNCLVWCAQQGIDEANDIVLTTRETAPAAEAATASSNPHPSDAHNSDAHLDEILVRKGDETYTRRQIQQLARGYGFEGEVESTQYGFGDPPNLDEAVRLADDVVKRRPSNPSEARKRLVVEESVEREEEGGQEAEAGSEVAEEGQSSRRSRVLQPKGPWPEGMLYGMKVREMESEASEDLPGWSEL